MESSHCSHATVQVPEVLQTFAPSYPVGNLTVVFPISLYYQPSSPSSHSTLYDMKFLTPQARARYKQTLTYLLSQHCKALQSTSNISLMMKDITRFFIAQLRQTRSICSHFYG